MYNTCEQNRAKPVPQMIDPGIKRCYTYNREIGTNTSKREGYEMEKVRVNARINRSTLETAKRHAKKEGETLSEYVEQALKGRIISGRIEPPVIGGSRKLVAVRIDPGRWELAKEKAELAGLSLGQWLEHIIGRE